MLGQVSVRSAAHGDHKAPAKLERDVFADDACQILGPSRFCGEPQRRGGSTRTLDSPSAIRPSCVFKLPNRLCIPRTLADQHSSVRTSPARVRIVRLQMAWLHMENDDNPTKGRVSEGVRMVAVWHRVAAGRLGAGALHAQAIECRSRSSRADGYRCGQDGPGGPPCLFLRQVLHLAAKRRGRSTLVLSHHDVAVTRKCKVRHSRRIRTTANAISAGGKAQRQAE